MQSRRVHCFYEILLVLFRRIKPETNEKAVTKKIAKARLCGEDKTRSNQHTDPDQSQKATRSLGGRVPKEEAEMQR